MPDPASVPTHRTGNDGDACSAASGCTWLLGGASSMPLHHCGVSIGSLTSKTIDAALHTVVPVARPALGDTVNTTWPSPSGGVTLGGRKPASGSSVSIPVSGSI